MNNRTSNTEPWGIKPFDQVCGGLPKRVFTLVRSCSEEASVVAIGHYLKAGLKLGQRVTLVCFDHPSFLLEKFKTYGFDFYEEINKEQFIYLYYRPFFSHSLNIATNYRQLFDEALSLSKGEIGRIAFLNADALLNLETYLLAETSLEKIMEYARAGDFVMLGSYIANKHPPHRNLDQAGQSLLSSFSEIVSATYEGDRRYKLILHKTPLHFGLPPIDLLLVPGSGLEYPNIELIKYG